VAERQSCGLGERQHREIKCTSSRVVRRLDRDSGDGDGLAGDWRVRAEVVASNVRDEIAGGSARDAMGRRQYLSVADEHAGAELALKRVGRWNSRVDQGNDARNRTSGGGPCCRRRQDANNEDPDQP
jgi:hypothetical protein